MAADATHTLVSNRTPFCRSSQAQARTAGPTPEPDPQTLLTHWRRGWLPLTGAALVAGFLGFYIIGTVTASFRKCPCSSTCDGEHTTPTGRPPALSGDNAEQFDKELNLPEWWMGVTKLRKKLAEQSHGDVLELAMGGGRNLEYYDWAPLTQYVEQVKSGQQGNQPATKSLRGITSFTGLDISVDMLDVARRKLVRTVPPMASSAPVVKASSMADNTGGQLSFLDNRLRLIQSDAHHELPPPAKTTNTTGGQSKYDTIVQTFGLCSVSDPVAVVQNLATAITPDTGKIILLEHGKGWYGIVNGLLDKNANQHFDKYGCWWNRDIQAIVDEAVAKTPGLEVVAIKRPNILQMGTLVWVELKMRNTKSLPAQP